MKHSISIKTTKGVFSISDFKKQNLSSEDVIGVILQTETIGMVISLDKWHDLWCRNKGSQLFNKACGEAEALQTLSGLELTRNIVEKNIADGETMTAAMRCWQYKKGNLQWYLPSLYELGTIIAYIDELNDVFGMLGADLLSEDDYGWSSSEYNNYNVWYVGFSGGRFNGYYNKSGDFTIIAVSAYSPLHQVNNDSHYPFTEESAIKYLRQLGYVGELTKKIKV